MDATADCDAVAIRDTPRRDHLLDDTVEEEVVVERDQDVRRIASGELRPEKTTKLGVINIPLEQREKAVEEIANAGREDSLTPRRSGEKPLDVLRRSTPQHVGECSDFIAGRALAWHGHRPTKTPTLLQRANAREDDTRIVALHVVRGNADEVIYQRHSVARPLKRLRQAGANDVHHASRFSSIAPDRPSIRVLASYEELYEELEAENSQNAEKPEARNLGLFMDLQFGRR